MRRTSVFALSLVLLVTVALADRVEGGPGIGTPSGTDEMNSPVKTPSDMPAASSPGAASPPPLDVAPPAPASDGNAVVADQLANQLKDISHHVKQVSGELAKTSSQIENVRDSSLRNDFADSIKKAALLRKVGANPKDFASWKQRHFPKHNITEAEALANEEQQANKLVKEDKELAAIMENAKKHPQQVEPVLPVVTGSLTKGLNEIAKTVNGYKSNVEQLNHNLESAIQAEKRKAAKEQTVEEIRNQLTSDTGDISQLKLRIAHLNDLEKLHSKTLKTKLSALSKEHKQKFKKLVYASRLKALNAWLKQKRRQRLLKMIHQLKVNKVYQRQQRLAQSLISKNAADLWKTFVNTVNKHKSLRDQQNHVLEEVETLHQKTMKKLKAVHLKEKHRIRSQIQKRYSELIKKHFATLKNLRKQRELLAKQLSARQQLVAQREKKLERVLKDEEAPASKDFPKVEDKQAEEQQKKLYRLIHKNRRFKALVEKLVRRQDQISGRKGKYWQTLRERIRKHVRALTERIEKNTQVIQTLSASAQAHHKHQEREKMLESKVQRLQHELEALRNKKDAPTDSKAAASTKKAAAAAAKTTDLLPPAFSPKQVKHSLRRHRATLKRLAHRSKKLYMHIRRGERRMRHLQSQLEEALNAYLKRKLRYQITRLRRRLRRLKHRLMLNIGQFLKTREDLLEKKKQYILRGEIKIKESIETVDPGKRRVLIIALAKMSRGVKYIDTQEAKLDRARRNLVHRTYRAILKALRRRRAHIKEKLEALKEKKDVSQGLAEERVQRQIERLENKLDDVSSKLSRVENTARIHMLVLKREVLRRKARELRRLIRAAANEDVLKNHEKKLEKVNARQEKLKHKISKARRVVITALNGDLQVLRKRKDHNVALISQLREHVAAAKGDEYKRQIRRLKRLQRKVFNIQRRIMMTEHKIEIITRMVANEDQVEDATPGWHKLTDDKPKAKHETLQKYNPPPPPPPSERPVSWFHSEKHVPPETYKPVVSTTPPNFANNNNAAAPAAAASAPAAAAPTPAPTPAPQHATAAARPVPQTHNAPAAPPATPLTPPAGLPKPVPTTPAANPAAELGRKAQRQPRKVLMMCLKIMEEEKQAILNQKNGVVNTTPAPPGPSPQQLQHAADAARAALGANKPAFVEVDETETEGQGAMVQLDEAMFAEDAVQTEAGRYCQDVVKSYQTWRLHNVCHESVPCSMKVPKNMVDFQDSRPKVPHGVNLDVPKPVPAPQVKTWNYAQGGADWNSGLCKTGRMQSPIRLDEGAANFTTNQHESRGNKYQLRFSYQPAMNLTVHHHDGYAISVRPSIAGTLGYLRSGCCDDTKYRVESFHFHAKGEHVFGGRNSADQGHYPMEMHIVHRKEGTTGTDGILIVVVPFERKHTPGSNKFLDAVDFNDLPRSIGGSRVITNVLDLNELSYSLSGDYFAYQGSLTTPGCDENIEYRILSQPQGMSQGQIDAITSLFKNLTEFPGYHGNYREVQPRNGREIVFFKAHVLDGNNSAYRHRKMQWFRTELPSSNSYFVPPK